MTPKQKRLSVAAAIATAIAIPAEGLRQVAYYDPPGILTVCYGSTTDVDPGKVYSLAECRARMESFDTVGGAVLESCDLVSLDAGRLDATLAMIANPDISTEELMEFVPAPDFPTGAELVSPAADFRSIYQTGNGTLGVGLGGFGLGSQCLDEFFPVHA
jgi:hypothetical protein